MIKYVSGFIIVEQTWPELKVTLHRKSLSLQYVLDTEQEAYVAFAIDGQIVYQTSIYTGTVPSDANVSQTDNDTYKLDFEANFKSRTNYPLTAFQDGDPRWIYRFGNLVSSGSAELLVSNRGYFEPQSQAQRSVVSTSAQDSNPAGTGAKQVRITYLNSSYQQKVEDVFLNGTSPVNTVNTDIRFIEKFEVIKGTAAAGAVTLRASTSGGEVCSIGPGTTDAFLCHHYVPSGSRADVIEWSATASDDTLMRLKGQSLVSGNLVDVVLDLDNLTGIASGSRLDFERSFKSLPLGEKTYVRITSQAQQGTSTTIRARLNVWEDVLYVSGSI